MSLKKKICWAAIFAIAMGYLEGAVVVYLRELYYPHGFNFPLVVIPDRIAVVEVFREAATIFMLVAFGALTGRTFTQRFSWFAFAFGVWDLVYYLVLYLVYGWPKSLGTWDILFLIPCPWVSPVWAPVLISLLLIGGSVCVLHYSEKNSDVRISSVNWWIAIAGALVCILSFIWDFLKFSSDRSDKSWLLAISDPEAFSAYIPQSFNAGLFGAGFLLLCASLILFLNQNRINSKNQKS